MEGPANSIEWLTDHVDDPGRDSTSRRSGWLGYTMIAVVGLVVLAFGVLTVVSHERVESPLAATAASAASVPEADDPDRFQTAIATLPDLTVIMPQFAGEPAIRVDSGVGAVVNNEAYDQLHSFSVDASGRWLAALSGSSAGGQADLWVGRIDGTIEIAATDIRGFAWHDHQPATLAFGARNGSADGAAFMADVTSGDFEPELLFPTEHHVEHWGDWGFVVRPILTDQGFHLLSPEGEEIATEYRGSVAGVIDSGLVVNLAGGRQSPLLIFPTDGRAWPIFTLTDTQVARSVVDGGHNDAVAVQVAHFETNMHEIRIFDVTGRPPATIPTTEATGAMTWSDDGSTLLFLRQDVNGVTELVQYDHVTGAIVTTPIDASPSINHATSAIAGG